MSSRPVTRVRDVMQTDFDLIDGMATVEDALNGMQHPLTRCLIVD